MSACIVVTIISSNMGITGLMKLLESPEAFDACCPQGRIRGTIVVDGTDLLHQVFRDSKLDWAHGGQYLELRRVLSDFFGALQRGGVNPIVVLDGGGEESQILDLVHRRNRSITGIPEDRQRELARPHSDTRHYLPILASSVIANTVEKLRIPLYVADGRADSTVVELANHGRWPVLGGDSIYCIYNVHGGYIAYEYLDWRSSPITGRVFHQRAFAEQFRLRDSTLCTVIPAILGDGSENSVPRLYYGPLKYLIDPKAAERPADPRMKCSNTVQYVSRFRSHGDFVSKISSMPIGRQQKDQLRDNCRKAKSLYLVSATVSRDDLNNWETSSIRCSGGRQLPAWVFERYRRGRFPSFLVSAAVASHCPLHYQVGDEKQPPVPVAGSRIRRIMYGLMSGLMQPGGAIKEYYRNLSGSELTYATHQVDPICDLFQELNVANIELLSNDERTDLAKEVIRSILECPPEVIAQFDTWEDNNWLLVVAITWYWAKHPLVRKELQNLTQVVKSLVYCFVFCTHLQASDGRVEDFPRSCDNPNWLQAYHAYLQWQSLYFDATALNQLLMEPLEVMTPASLYDGCLALHYATCTDARELDRKISSLSPENKQLYDKLLLAVLR